MPTNTSGGTTTSFANTPQAKDDLYLYTEEQLLSSPSIYNKTTRTLSLNVMSNDLGGNAKNLYSIDDGGTGAMNDLLQSNVTTAWEQTAEGNWIRINAGVIEYRIDDGSHSYANARDVNSLNEGETISDTFVYAIRMANGTLSWATVTITLTGSNDLASISGTTTGGVTEDGDGITTFQTVSGTLTVTDPDSGQNEVQPIADGTSGDNGYGTFEVLADGTWTYTLNNDDPTIQELAEGETLTDTITVTSEDGTDTEVITVTITGTNDAPTVTDVGTAADEDGSSVTASFSGEDIDSDDDGASLTYALTSSPSEGSVVNNGDGTFTFDPGSDFQDLADGETRDVTFSYTATDSHGATSNSGTVTVTVTGTNDAPTASLTNSVTTNEDTTSSAVSIGATDVEGDTLTYSVKSTAQPAHGTVSFNQTAGTFTYTPNANYNGSDSFTIVIDDGNGGTTEQVVSVTVNSVNDPAVITGAISGSVTEDAVPNTVSGNLNSTDVDGVNDSWNAVAAAAPSANGYGTYTIDAAGNWVYTLNNGNPTVNALNNGGTLSDSFTVTTADGTSQVVSITINGHTDVVAVTLPPTFTGTGDPNDFDNLGNPAGQNLSGNATNGNDTIYGGAGADTINGGGGDDTIYGGSGGDNLGGGNDGDHLYGGSGTDTISGGNNNDTIIGGYGADNLTGSNGNDTFVYLDAKDTNDTITDFTSGDKIDLSAIDANSNLGGDQGFAFGGTTATANGVWYAQSGANVIVYVDTDGNASTAELAITLANTTTANLSQTDFLLGP